MSARIVERLPLGVVKLTGFLSDEARQRLYDNVLIAGWDHRVSGSYADSVYTNAVGAPDILLHYNYYSAPPPDQPPPMDVLQIADAVYRGYREMVVQEEATLAVDAVHPDRFDQTRAGADSQRNGIASVSTTSSCKSERAASPTQEEYEARLLEERRARCYFPREADFRSVLALGYRATDTFRWHTDMAGDDGWVCSFSLGATATFEYLPQIAPSARNRIDARAQSEPVRVQVGCGDCLMFHGGYLPHRITRCDGRPSEAFAGLNADNSIARLNLQCRVYGASPEHGLANLLGGGVGGADS